jgi:regulator of replication initiation timing
MAKQVALARPVDLEFIDRLEEKIKLLVAMVSRLRADQARAAEEQTRLMEEIDALRARLADAESTNVELISLREERDVIRTRVTEMLSHLDGLAV